MGVGITYSNIIMKNLLLVLGCLVLTSCGVSSSSVRKTVAIEKDCPKENVKILEKEKGFGRATYSIDACGKVYTYKVIGTTISEKEK